MRIGIVCPYAWDVPGGVQVHVRDLAETLIERGHDVSVLTPVEDPANLPPYAVDGGRPRAIPYNGSVARLTLGVKATARVRRWVRHGDFDVLHVHEPLAPSLGGLACWAARGPIVATVHSSIERSRVLATGYYLAQTVLEKVSAIIAVSEHARRTLVDHVGADAVLIPNGVRVDRFARAAPLRDWGSPTVLFLGRLDERRKGLPVLLDAFSLLRQTQPDVRLVIVGPGDPGEVLADVDPMLREHITCLGRVDDEVKAQALASVDIYVAPNTGGESFGIVLLEAMAAGTPVVASDLEAFERVLDGGRCGVMFPGGDHRALAGAIEELLRDPARCEALSTLGRQRAQRYDWGSVSEDVLRVYESVVSGQQRVEEDLRGQIVGRLAGRGRGSDA
ncbi:MAG: glycosyltransferase family 4 protein [Actinobacteria bacterium]|nr:glycosyltransferase family 4 protein [Actinomycetota bacterium]